MTNPSVSTAPPSGQTGIGESPGENPDRQPLRVAFVHAPDPVYSDTQNYGTKFMPVWAYTLAAHVPDDGRYRMALYDTRFDPVSSIG